MGRCRTWWIFFFEHNLLCIYVYFFSCCLATLLVLTIVLFLYDPMQSAEPHVMQEKQREIKQLFKKWVSFLGWLLYIDLVCLSFVSYSFTHAIFIVGYCFSDNYSCTVKSSHDGTLVNLWLWLQNMVFLHHILHDTML